MHNKRLKYVNSNMKYSKICKIKILDMLLLLLIYLLYNNLFIEWNQPNPNRRNQNEDMLNKNKTKVLVCTKKEQTREECIKINH